MVLTVLVTGGRDYTDHNLVHRCLSALDPDMVVHGGCRTGADRFAHYWCMGHPNVIEKIYPADWSHGPKGGPLRNQQMVDDCKPDALVLAFPGGRGTADCVRRARAAGLIVKEAG